MSLTYPTVQAEAQAVQLVCEQVISLFNGQISAILEHNSSQGIDWAASPLPSYITEDSSGNLSGLTYSRQAVANAIGSLNQIQNLLTGNSASQGNHLGNLELIARPLA